MFLRQMSREPQDARMSQPVSLRKQKNSFQIFLSTSLTFAFRETTPLCNNHCPRTPLPWRWWEEQQQQLNSVSSRTILFFSSTTGEASERSEGKNIFMLLETRMRWRSLPLVPNNTECWVLWCWSNTQNKAGKSGFEGWLGLSLA